MQLLADKDTVRSATIFRGLAEAEFNQALQSAQQKHLADEAFFFMEADPAEAAYVLLEGKVKLTQVTVDGQQVILGYLVPGRVFGIIALLKKMTYPVSAQAVGDCRALVWEQAELNHLMEAMPRMALNAMRIMAGQIREFQNRVRELSTQRVAQRIALAILRLARQSGREIDDGVMIDLPLSRQDLAEMTGTTMYTVSRILKEWGEKEIIQSKRQQVIVLKPGSLLLIAEDLLPFKEERNTVGELCDL